MRPVILLLLLVTVNLVVSAQHSSGYFFAGPGGVSNGSGSTLHVGGGGEFVFLKRAGAGLEVGALGLTRSLSHAIAVVSTNGYVHFPRGRKFDGFLTAGYSRLQRSGGVNAFNYGVGATYWLRRHLGIRIDYRDHIANEYTRTTHFWGVRFGLAF